MLTIKNGFNTLHNQALSGNEGVTKMFYGELTPEWLDGYDENFEYGASTAMRMGKFIVCRNIVIVAPYWDGVTIPIHIHLAKNRPDLHEMMEHQIQLAEKDGIPILRSKVAGIQPVTDAGHLRILPDTARKTLEVFGSSLHYGNADLGAPNGRYRSIEQMKELLAGSDWRVQPRQ